MLKVQRGGKCERCGERSKSISSLVGHHKTELTEGNVDNASISLNPARIEILCPKCHNALDTHDRFHHTKHVYIIYGSPLSGKTSTARGMMTLGDIAVDMDMLYQAITLQPPYIKPNSLRFNVFRLRDCLLDQIKTRYGQWSNAYIIGGYPDKYEREVAAKEYGAEVLYCESTEDECLRRRRESGRPDEWDRYIREWWEKFRRYPPG
jgi:hypothetical protein